MHPPIYQSIGGHHMIGEKMRGAACVCVCCSRGRINRWKWSTLACMDKRSIYHLPFNVPWDTHKISKCDEYFVTHMYLRPMAITQVTTVTQVCADYDSYLKIGPNHKKRGKDCRARWALFALIMTTIPGDFGFYSKSARLVSAHGHKQGAWGVSKA